MDPNPNPVWTKVEYDFDIDEEAKTYLKRQWNSKDTMQLIKILERECKELWDTSHPLYKLKTARKLKLEYLANIFSTSSEEINRKIHNLRTQMNNELRKLKRKKGAPEASRWEYFHALTFLQRTTPADPLEAVEAVNDELAELEVSEPKEFAVWLKGEEPRIHPNPTNPIPDECQIFGDFVASELRLLESMDSRKRLKRIIQKAIIQVSEEDNKIKMNK